MDKTISLGQNFGKQNLKTYEIIIRFSNPNKKISLDDIGILKKRFESIFKPLHISNYLTRYISINELGGSAIFQILYENNVNLIDEADWIIIKDDSESLMSQLENLLSPLLE
jgi:hypothetical protein